MSNSGTPATPSRSPAPLHALSVAQQLPQSIVTLVSRHLTLDTSEQRRETFKDRQKDARNFACVCRAWRAAGTAAVWREVEIVRSSAKQLVGHLEAHPELYKHVESATVEVCWSTLSRLDDSPGPAPVILASCRRLGRLDIRGDVEQPGPFFQMLQSRLDLTKLVEISIVWDDAHGDHFCHQGAADRVVSSILLFAFIRACKNLRRFSYDGMHDYINESATAPVGRRIKLDALTLDIKDTTSTGPDDDTRASIIRARFLVQFDLARLVEFNAHVNLWDEQVKLALGRMVNLEKLRLLDDYGVYAEALDELASPLECLNKLRELQLTSADDDLVPDCPTSPDGLESVQVLLDALPASLERLRLSVPLPEPMAQRFFDGRRTLERFSTSVYDPLEVSPEPREEHWRKVVEDGPALQQGGEVEDGLGEGDAVQNEA
ncbi:hypothetical protein JCM9279_003143 [Rhodotorula babjevae]